MTTQNDGGSHSKIKVNKKGYTNAAQELALLEPDDHGQMIHAATNKTY